jgi:hypothetical protein
MEAGYRVTGTEMRVVPILDGIEISVNDLLPDGPPLKIDGRYWVSPNTYQAIIDHLGL